MTNNIGNYHDDSDFHSSSIEVDGSIFSLSLLPFQQTSQMLSINPIPSLFQLNMPMMYYVLIPVEPNSQNSLISICPYKCSLFPSDFNYQKLPYQSHTVNSPLLFIFHTNNLNEWNHLFNMHSNSLITTSRSIVTLSLLRIIRLIGIHHQDTTQPTLLFNYTWSMFYNLCINRDTHPLLALHEDLLVPSTTNSSNQLHLTLVPATKFSAHACIKLLFSTLSCISIFVSNVSNHYTSKNRHQSFTFPPLITFLPLIVNRIPAGIGWIVLPAFIYMLLII